MADEKLMRDALEAIEKLRNENAILKAAITLAAADSPAEPTIQDTIAKAFRTGGAVVGDGTDPDPRGIDLTNKIRSGSRRVAKADRPRDLHDLTGGVQKRKAALEAEPAAEAERIKKLREGGQR